MLRRLLPSLGRGIVSTAVPGATHTQTLLPHHRASASRGGAVFPYDSILGANAVLPRCPRCSSSAATPTSSSLPPPRGPPWNGRRGSAATTFSPSLPPPRGPPWNGRRGSAATTFSPSLPPPRGPPWNGRRGSAATTSSPSLPPPRGGGSTATSLTRKSPVIINTRGDPDADDPLQATDARCPHGNEPKIPHVPWKWISPFEPFKRSFCSTTNVHDIISGGPVLETSQLPAGIDWTKYIHVKKFDCCGQELYTDAVLVQQYVEKNPMIEVRRIYGNILGMVDPWGQPVKETDSFVKDKAKKFVKNLIDGMSEFHRAGVCVVSLDRNNVVAAAGGTVAKFTDVTFVRATLELKKKNYRWLKNVVQEDIFEGKPLPCDMQRLVYIMETHPVASEYLMKNYIALVPQVNKSAFYLRLYERIKILLFINSEFGKRLLRTLPYNYHWRDMMRLNTVLNSIITYGTGYDTVDDPYIFALCFKHSCYHKCDRCCHPSTKIQLYTADMFEDIQESTFRGYVATLEEQMYRTSQLQYAKVEDLL